MMLVKQSSVSRRFFLLWHSNITLTKQICLEARSYLLRDFTARVLTKWRRRSLLKKKGFEFLSMAVQHWSTVLESKCFFHWFDYAHRVACFKKEQLLKKKRLIIRIWNRKASFCALESTKMSRIEHWVRTRLKRSAFLCWSSSLRRVVCFNCLSSIHKRRLLSGSLHVS